MSLPVAVHSIEALERFRSALVVYQEKAMAVLHEIGYEVGRTRRWVQDERLGFWKAEIRRIERSLDDAEQQLFRAELSEFRDTPSAEQRQVRRLREAKRAAEEKLRTTESWAREFETRVGPLVKPVERLRSELEGVSHAIHSLSGMIKALEDYANAARPGVPPPAPPDGALSPPKPPRLPPQQSP